MMNKTLTSLTLALAISASAFADDGTKQVVKINGTANGKAVQTITFSGDYVKLVYTDNSTETLDMESVVISFEYDATAITVSSVAENGETKKIYDINGRQVRSTLDALPQGVYIIKSANKSVKFIKK
ncbi:MAG: T9SS type A sorting domain-containing protein [Bacteroidaceae bacterium]|nr:T9SS type A sorting domain-containing protein [Bacteroidaceae bacterium]